MRLSVPELDDLERVPYIRGGRSDISGLDCLGLILVAFQRAGLRIDDWPDYCPPGYHWVNPPLTGGIQPMDIVFFDGDTHIALATSENSLIEFSPGQGLTRRKWTLYKMMADRIARIEKR